MARLHFTIPVPPGLLALNRKHERHTFIRDGVTLRTIGNTKSFEAAFDEAVLAVRQAVVLQGWTEREGPVSVGIVAHWPERKGDIDAPVKAVLDALQAGGVVTNDRLCIGVKLQRAWRADYPRIDVVVEDVGESALRMFDQGGDR